MEKYQLPEMNALPIQRMDTLPAPSMGQELAPPSRGNLAMELVYPEIFYRVQPLIILVCDQLENYNITPTQDMIEQFSSSICTELCQVYPDLNNYSYHQENDDPSMEIKDYGLRGQLNINQDLYLRRFRKRGSLYDLISILLLAEIFRRLS